MQTDNALNEALYQQTAQACARKVPRSVLTNPAVKAAIIQLCGAHIENAKEFLAQIAHESYTRTGPSNTETVIALRDALAEIDSAEFEPTLLEEAKNATLPVRAMLAENSSLLTNTQGVLTALGFTHGAGGWSL